MVAWDFRRGRVRPVAPSTSSPAGEQPKRCQFILAVGPLPPPVHGASKVTAGMVRLMREHGLAVTCIDTGANGRFGLRYHWIRILRHLKATGEALRPSTRMVYIGGAGGLGLLYQSLVVLAARVRGVPILFHHHSGRYIDKRYLPAVVLRLVFGGRVEHVVLSQAMASGILASFPRSYKVHIWSNACHVELSSFPRQRRTASEKVITQPIVFGHLCNLSIDKGLPDVIDVLRTAMDVGMNAKLVVAGPVAGAAEAALIQRAEADFGDHFSYQGPLEPGQVARFMAPLDIFLFSSRYVHEAEPLVVLEAAAVGVPTIAAGNSSVRELVEALAGEVIYPTDAFGVTAIRLAPHMVSVERRRKVHGAFLTRRSQAAHQIASYLRDRCG